jgi:hypothetical protein
MFWYIEIMMMMTIKQQIQEQTKGNNTDRHLKIVIHRHNYLITNNKTSFYQIRVQNISA